MADVSEASAQIELLDQNLKKTHVLSSRMTGILTHFDTRLNRLERTILPLHNSTQSLTRLSANIDATLAALSSVRVNQEKTLSDDAAIMTPPYPANLAPYMAALNRVLEHIDDLKGSGLRGEGGIKEKAKLAEIGYKQLCNILVKQITDGSNQPLDLDSASRTPQTPLRSLPTQPLLLSSNLANYLLSSPLSKTSSANTHQLEDTLIAWGELRAGWMKKGVESFGRKVLEGKEGAGRLVEGVLGVAKAEHSLLLSLLPTPSLSPTLTILLTQILTPTLTYLSSTLLSVVQALKKEPLPWKAYTIYEALDNVSVKWDEFVRAAGLSGNATMKGVVRDVLGSGTGLKGLCLRSLPEAVEGAKIAPMLRPGEPPSVAVSMSTTATVAYLLKLPGHQDTIEEFLTQLGDRKWLMGGTATASKGDDDGESGVLEHFVFDVVAALIGALEARGKGMRKGLGAIFLVNNVSYVRDNLLLSSSSISDLLGDSGENLLNKSFRTAKAIYLDLYNELLLNLTDPHPLQSSTPRLGLANPMKTSDSVDRQTTKDGFTKFWDTLEGIEGVHRSNKLEKSGEVKERLRAEVKTLVGKGYRDAVKKWAGSLGVKYIRSTPDDLDHRIEALFK